MDPEATLKNILYLLDEVSQDYKLSKQEVSDNLDQTLAQLIGGIQAGMGYLGAHTLPNLREKARYIRVSPAGQREAAPHDVVEMKPSQ